MPTPQHEYTKVANDPGSTYRNMTNPSPARRASDANFQKESRQAIVGEIERLIHNKIIFLHNKKLYIIYHTENEKTIPFLLLAPPIQQVALEEILDHPILLDLIDSQGSLLACGCWEDYQV